MPNAFTRKIQRATLQHHIVVTETIIEKRTSPAARSPYAGTNESTQATGFTIVIAAIICIHSAALSASMPAISVTGCAAA